MDNYCQKIHFKTVSSGGGLAFIELIKMTKIIGLVQAKGGAGRSTVSTNLAGELSKSGKTVLIDCDMPQGTSASWFAVRQQKGRQGNLKADTAIDHSDLINKVKQHQDADYIVLMVRQGLLK
jgi:chromosome partitioning protein